MKDKNIIQLMKRVGEQNILEVIGDGISIQDTDFKVLYQNKALKDIIGNHTGKYCYKAYEKREKICKGCPVALSFKDGKVHSAERIAPTDRGALHVEITSSPLIGPEGEIIAGIEIVRDISKHKKMVDDLLKSEE